MDPNGALRANNLAEGESSGSSEGVRGKGSGNTCVNHIKSHQITANKSKSHQIEVIEIAYRSKFTAKGSNSPHLSARPLGWRPSWWTGPKTGDPPISARNANGHRENANSHPENANGHRKNANGYREHARNASGRPELGSRAGLGAARSVWRGKRRGDGDGKGGGRGTQKYSTDPPTPLRGEP